METMPQHRNTMAQNLVCTYRTVINSKIKALRKEGTNRVILTILFDTIL